MDAIQTASGSVAASASAASQCSGCRRTVAAGDAFKDPAGAVLCPKCQWNTMNRNAQVAARASGGAFAPEQTGIRRGMLGGVLMMGIAALWFFAGLSANRVFFYPPILFVIGVYAFVKGAFTGNLAGK
jgi:hypothetical protein